MMIQCHTARSVVEILQHQSRRYCRLSRTILSKSSPTCVYAKHRPYSQSAAPKSSQLIDEETLPGYDADDYYPVKPGQLLNDRYMVHTKLGYGRDSTVWLCEDQQRNSFRTLKLGVKSDKVNSEVRVLEHINSKGLQLSSGCQWVRHHEEWFEMQFKGCTYPCLVFEPMGISLNDLWDMGNDPSHLGLSAIPVVSWALINALSYLHRCGVVHTDLKFDNIQFMLPEKADAILEKHITLARENAHKIPSRRIDDDRTIYASLVLQYSPFNAIPILCDLGSAAFGRDTYVGLAQPQPYRAPEVILGLPWDSKIDIWNLGELVCTAIIDDEYTSLLTLYCSSGRS